MSHMILELVLWMLLAFFSGCVMGYLARLVAGQESELAVAVALPRAEPVRVAAQPEAAAAKSMVAEPHPGGAAPPAPDPPPTPRAAVAPDPLPAAASGRPERPRGIAEPRGGKPDNLQRISGIGPKNERTLHSLGFYHFDQIASWTEDQIDWVDDHLKFNGRIMREEWILQARLLAGDKEEEFLQLYGTGGLKSRSGEARSGARTRRR